MWAVVGSFQLIRRESCMGSTIIRCWISKKTPWNSIPSTLGWRPRESNTFSNVSRHWSTNKKLSKGNINRGKALCNNKVSSSAYFLFELFISKKKLHVYVKTPTAYQHNRINAWKRNVQILNFKHLPEAPDASDKRIGEKMDACIVCRWKDAFHIGLH